MSAELPRLVTERYELRLADVSDVPRLLSYRREQRRSLPAVRTGPGGRSLHRAFWVRQVERDHDEFEAGLSVRFYLFEPGPGAPVLGLASFSNIVRGPFQSCFLGYALAESQQGRGLMTGALRLGIAYMFDEMHLHRISANYVPHNTRSAAVSEAPRLRGRRVCAGLPPDRRALAGPHPHEPDSTPTGLRRRS